MGKERLKLRILRVKMFIHQALKIQKIMKILFEKNNRKNNKLKTRLDGRRRHLAEQRFFGKKKRFFFGEVPRYAPPPFDSVLAHIFDHLLRLVQTKLFIQILQF